jgi:hypothetical protein
MAYPGTPVQRLRPGTVTVASFLLFGLAFLQLISVVVQLTAVGTTVQAIRDYGTQVGDTTTANAAATATQVTTYIAVAFALIYAAAFAVLGMFVGRGRNAARITTWVLAGLSLCCGVAGLAGNAASGLMQGSSSSSAFDSAAMTRFIQNKLPGWYTPVVATLSVLTIVLAVAVIILLALPASNEFFRKPASTGWEPPVPGSGYPPPGGGYPPAPGGGYPPAPGGGYPPAPGGGYPPPSGGPSDSEYPPPR